MNFVTKQYLYNLISEKELNNISVFGSDAKTLMLEIDGGDETPSDVMTQVSAFFDEAAMDGVYVVKLSNKSKKQKGAGGDWKSYGFRIKIGDTRGLNSIGANNAQMNDSYNRELIQKNIELTTKVVMLEQEAKRKEDIALLEKKIEKLKEESPLDKFAPLIAGFFQNAQTTAAASKLAAVAGPEDTKGKIQAALKRLMKVDPNFVDTLTSLADFAESNPEKFLSFIPLLKSM